MLLLVLTASNVAVLGRTRVRPDTVHVAIESGPRSQGASLANMLPDESCTMITTMKPLKLNTELELVRAHNALTSWTKAVREEHIIVFADEPTACSWVAHSGFRSIRCVVHSCIHEEYKRPTVSCLMEEAIANADTKLLCLLNIDIMVSSRFSTALNIAFGLSHKNILLVGRRTDVPVDSLVSFREGWDIALEEEGKKQGALHKEWGIDYFVFKKESYPQFGMLPFLVGVWRWDNYWLSQAVLDDSFVVIDASEAVPVFHQGVDKPGDRDSNHSVRVGAEYNDELTVKATSQFFMLGKTNNADFVLDSGLQIVTNEAKGDLSRIAKRASSPHASGWVAILYSNGETWGDFPSWADRVKFDNFAVLSDDCSSSGQSDDPHVVCRHRNQMANSSDPALEQFLVDRMRTELLIGFHQLNLTFVYGTHDSVRKARFLGTELRGNTGVSQLTSVRVVPAECDVVIDTGAGTDWQQTEGSLMIGVRPCWQTKYFLKKVVECQLKGLKGKFGEDVENDCIRKVALAPWVNDVVVIC